MVIDLADQSAAAVERSRDDFRESLTANASRRARGNERFEGSPPVGFDTAGALPITRVDGLLNRIG